MKQENRPQPAAASPGAVSSAPVSQSLKAAPAVHLRALTLAELPEAMALTRARPELGVIADEAAVARVIAHNPENFWGIFPAGAGAPLLGYYGLLLLSEAGEAAILDEQFDPFNPAMQCLVPGGKAPAAVYFWLAVAPGLAVVTSPLIDAVIARLAGGAPMYGRPATEAGLIWVKRSGFRPVDPHKDRIGGYFVVGNSKALAARAESSTAGGFTVKTVRDSETWDHAIAIRAAIVMAELAGRYRDAFDGNDATATHMVAYEDEEPVAALRIRYFAGFAQIERMAIMPRYRGTGAGKVLVDAALAFVRRKGYRKVTAQIDRRFHAQWPMDGFEPLEAPFRFEHLNRTYDVLTKTLEPDAAAFTLMSDPYVLLRPEGAWDEPGVLEKSASRPATNPH